MTIAALHNHPKSVMKSTPSTPRGAGQRVWATGWFQTSSNAQLQLPSLHEASSSSLPTWQAPCKHHPNLHLTISLKETRGFPPKADGERLPSATSPRHWSRCADSVTSTIIIPLDAQVVAFLPCLRGTSLTEATGKGAEIPV